MIPELQSPPGVILLEADTAGLEGPGAYFAKTRKPAARATGRLKAPMQEIRTPLSRSFSYRRVRASVHVLRCLQSLSVRLTFRIATGNIFRSAHDTREANG